MIEYDKKNEPRDGKTALKNGDFVKATSSQGFIQHAFDMAFYLLLRFQWLQESGQEQSECFFDHAMRQVLS